MTNFRMALRDLLRKDEQGADPPFLRDGLQLPAQELMDAEVTEAIGAAPYERSHKRLTSRNGVREREWDTRMGTIELAIPKLLSRIRSQYPPRWARRTREIALDRPLFFELKPLSRTSAFLRRQPLPHTRLARGTHSAN